MSIKLVYRNDVPSELLIPKEVLPNSGMAFSHHFQSTPQDNLIELAGRTCYDSCKQEKTRSSTDYHKHINDVNHGSVQEQCNLVFEITTGEQNMEYLFLNRPGIWIDRYPYHIELTANVRAIKEWALWIHNASDPVANRICQEIQCIAKEIVPLAMKDVATIDLEDVIDTFSINPKNANQIWLSFYISGVSRGLSHEWVRHKYQTAISQRSTRYVDESESDWIWHPLFRKYQKEINASVNWYADDDFCCYPFIIEEAAKYAYSNIVNILETQLISEEIDKFTARKQARGAARGVLGNALSTEMIWSGSLAQIIRIIKQRATEAADAEVRLLANELYEIVQPIYPEYFVGTTKKPCSDGIGYSVIWP